MVEKINGNGSGRFKKAEPIGETHSSDMPHGHGHCCGPVFAHSKHLSHFGRKLLWTLFGILLAYLVVLVGTMIRNNLEKFDHIGKADSTERTILVEGRGKVIVTPDIAITDIGMITQGKTVSEAQAKNTTVMNKLVERLKALEVEAKDIQTTSYYINPRYDYPEGEAPVISGYEVNQSVKVKIRDLNQANQILQTAGDVGANSVNGLSFTVDDREAVKDQARQEALSKVKEKAQALSQALGVRLVDVVSYNEYEGGDGKFGPYYAYADGMGGSGEAPNIEPGSTEVVVNVSVTFAIE